MNIVRKFEINLESSEIQPKNAIFIAFFDFSYFFLIFFGDNQFFIFCHYSFFTRIMRMR